MYEIHGETTDNFQMTDIDVSRTIQIGISHHQALRFEEAEAVYNDILKQDPQYSDSWHLLGLIAYQQGKLDLAVDRINRAIAIDDSKAVYHYNLGIALNSQHKLDEAAQSYRKAISLQPENADALNNLGNALRRQGLIQEALEILKKAMTIDPRLPEFHSNYLLTLNSHPSLDQRTIYKEHRRWAKQHAEALTLCSQSHPNDPDPERRLRIGYVSPDFRSHSVSFFLEPIFRAHDRSQFEVYCYANVAKPDSTTALFKDLADMWRDIHPMPDEEVIDRIRRDEIDILIDLAGHTSGNRLLVFAKKPAPLQITYLGYPNTTGLAEIDYRLTDAWADPPDLTDDCHSETLVRLPQGFLCYLPAGSPCVQDPPALSEKYVTFGSFNNLSKVTPEAVSMWSRILKEVSNSRLVMKSRNLAGQYTRDRLRELFLQQGISQDKIEMIGYTPSHQEHISIYSRIDIALDTFPYNGTTTTCDALWMGVPVVVLAGQRHAARVGVSILSCVGLEELIAETQTEYVEKAIRLALDIGYMRKLRSNLRERMSKSPLTDAEGFTRSLEGAYRSLWRMWASNAGVWPKERPVPDSMVPTGQMRSHNILPESDSKPSIENPIQKQKETTGRNGPEGLTQRFEDFVTKVYDRRKTERTLSYKDQMLILADTILDQRFFESRNWNWRYGGIRYESYAIPEADPQKILVLHWPTALGDAAMASSFYSALRDRYPTSRIYLLGSAITAEAIYGRSGLIDVFMDNPLEEFINQKQCGKDIDLRALMEGVTDLVKNLTEERFDLLFNLQILPMSATLAKLANAKKYVGMTLMDDGMPVIKGNLWAPYLFGVSAGLMRPFNRIHRTKMLQGLLGSQKDAFLNPASLIDPEDARSVQAFFDENGIEDRDTIIGISPLSNLPGKIWKSYDRLIKTLVEEYGSKIILFGNQAESRALAEIIHRSGVQAIQATHFNLSELMVAICGCDLFISNDTGPLHLACLFRKKTIALFGPTILREVGPWGTDYVALQSNKCKDCFEMTCSMVPSCMDHIKIEDVLGAVEFHLNGDRNSLTRLSPEVTWHSPESGYGFDDNLDDLISRQYLMYFEANERDRQWIDRPQTQLSNGIEDWDKVIGFCRQFMEKVEKARNQLKLDNNIDAIEATAKDISASCGFLKNIVVMNDFRYLDKRLSIESQRDAYEKYYKGILKDVAFFIGNRD